MADPHVPLPTASAVLWLESHQVDLDAGTLRDAAGALVTLRPQAWAVLRQLVLHRGQVVGKEQLLASVWPGLVVTDNSVAQAVKDLRHVLGATGQRLVKTVARRGYLLLDAAAPAQAAALPAAPESLFGRAADFDALQALLQRHRLVTVVGPGGVGKTALALAAAHARAALGEDNTAWIDLTRLGAPSLVPAAICQALALPIAPCDDPVPAMLAALRPVQALVVLDNAEHLVDALAPLLRRIIDAAPGIHLLVTSQSMLRLEGEHALRLATLALPEIDAPLAEALQSPAVALFVDRVRAIDHRFELAEHNVAQVSRLCRRLDGLPLAIRLAAARVPLLGLAGIESRLGEGLKLLAGDGRDAPSRQQTLRAALEWSYGLLPGSEQALLRQLAVFVGGFTLALAIDLGHEAGIEEWELIERLNRLVERSLLEREGTDSPRFRLLEAQREFALRELDAQGEAHAARHRHARTIERAMHAANEVLWSSAHGPWFARWASEIDNVRAAMDWSARHDVALSASLVGASVDLFRHLDAAYELRRLAATLDARDIEALAPEVALRYWLARAALESGMGARAHHEFACTAEKQARICGDSRGLYVALCHRAATTIVPLDEMPALLAEIGRLEMPAWPTRLQAQRLLAAYVDHSRRDQWSEALQAAEAGWALAVDAGVTSLAATFANAILVGLLGLHRVDDAVRRSGELRPSIWPGPAISAIPFVGTSARCWLESGDVFAAKRLLEQMFALCRAVEWTYFEFFAALYVKVAMAENRLDAAARLLGYAAVAVRRAWHQQRPSAARDEVQSVLTAALGARAFERLCAEGEAMTPERVCALVLEEPSLREYLGHD